MAKICLCLTGKTLARDLEILEKYRKYADLAELRVDCLDPDERFQIRRFPEMAGLPVILTVRRSMDGGAYAGGEGGRITLLSKGLAFAEADRRRNFAYVDLEEDLYIPSLAEAARTFGTRIIRSWHNLRGVDADLSAKILRLRRTGEEIVKAAVSPRSLEDVIRVYRAARETAGMDKILLCMGEFGVSTRILAGLLGSFLSYTTPKEEGDLPLAAPGQLDPRELAELYRFREINFKTRIFGVTGYPLKFSASPRFFNSVFGIENANAVYVPFPADSIKTLLQLAEELGVSGLSVTVPHKEKVLPCLSYESDNVKSIGACNTLVYKSEGWWGFNTDARGFSDSLLEFAGKKNLRGVKLTIVGAGGAARAAAFEVRRLKGKALVINRSPARARDLALRYGFAWAALDGKGIEMMDKYADIIIQTTSAGMEPDIDTDPLAFYKFTGREMVMDLIYKPEKTRCLLRAQEAGCKILNGYDMLTRQARYQYEHFTGKEFPSSLVSRVWF
ncbi:MAG: type I 3-dehydroquinate dehydratase [Treponema sp.]|jgi:3-dehydroquinate dehydratase/shikimate dehydrogenase|nr:type I 3-dehydroquinate dehydratase [Treponema sp.]